MEQDPQEIGQQKEQNFRVKAVLAESFERIHRSNLIEWEFYHYSLLTI